VIRVRRQTELFSLGCRVDAIAPLPDGRLLVAGESDARIWSRGESRPTTVPGAADSRSVPLRALAAMNDGRMVVVRSGDVGVWKLAAEWSGPVAKLPGSVLARAAGVFGDGRVVLGGADGVRVWKPGGGGSEVVRERFEVAALAPLGNDRIVVSALAGNALMLLQTGSPKMTVVGVASSPVRALAALDAAHVISGDVAGHLNVWNVDSPGSYVPFGEHPGVTAIVALPDGRVLSGGDDGKVLEWDTTARPDVRAIQAELRERLGSTELTPHETRLAGRK
jgi:hypothetical protein